MSTEAGLEEKLDSIIDGPRLTAEEIRACRSPWNSKVDVWKLAINRGCDRFEPPVVCEYKLGETDDWLSGYAFPQKKEGKWAVVIVAQNGTVAGRAGGYKTRKSLRNLMDTAPWLRLGQKDLFDGG